MRHIALVRNIMLGRDGLDRVTLLDTVARAGGSRARSYLTTGNVTFDARPKDIDAVCRRVETELSRLVSRPTMVAIRTVSWLCDLVSDDLFSDLPDDQWECEVGFLRHSAEPVDPRTIPATRRTLLVATRERELATMRPRTGPARPHVNRLLERASGQPATARGWGTLQRIAADP